MLKWLSRILTTIGIPSDIQLLGTLLITPAIIGAVTGWLSWVKENPHWSILIGLCASAATIWIIAGIQFLVRRNRVFKGLHFQSSEPLGIEISEEDTIFIPLLVRLRNTTSRELFFNVVRADFELNGRTNRSMPRGETQASVPAGQLATFRVAGIPNLPFEPDLAGSLEFEVEYGLKPDDLRYRLRYTFEPWIRIPQKPSEDHPQVQLTYDGRNAIQKHQKRKWI